MKYSIIIPVHNNEKTIERAVNSIISQKGFEVQVILVENGSSDFSRNKCEYLAKTYSCVECYINDVIGVSAARNLGLAKVTGDIIGFCDADDYYLDGAFDFVNECFSNNQISMLITGLITQTAGKEYKKITKKSKIISSHDAIEQILCNPKVMGSVWNKFYSKEILRNIMFPENITHLEDGYFNINVLSKNKSVKILLCNKATYCYVFNPNSVTARLKNDFDKHGRMKYYYSLYGILKDMQLAEKEKSYVKNAMYRLAAENIFRDDVKIDYKKYNFLLQEVKKYYFIFLCGFYKYDVKHKIKLLLIGVLAIIKH